VNEKWAWEKGELPYTGEALRSAIAKNPYMKTFVAQGYFDLATPHFATQYMLTHMNVDPELRSNITTRFYEAGHMFYLDRRSVEAFRGHVAEFVKQSS
jgi:carboxypeptidase C (cathepsin A)